MKDIKMAAGGPVKETNYYPRISSAEPDRQDRMIQSHPMQADEGR